MVFESLNTTAGVCTAVVPVSGGVRAGAACTMALAGAVDMEVGAAGVFGKPAVAIDVSDAVTEAEAFTVDVNGTGPEGA